MGNKILWIGGALLAGFYVGRAVQKKLSQLVIIELVENDTTMGYMKIDQGIVSYEQNIEDASLIQLEDAANITKVLKEQLGAGQSFSFIKQESTALV
jgi:hypothetical protein